MAFCAVGPGRPAQGMTFGSHIFYFSEPLILFCALKHTIRLRIDPSKQKGQGHRSNTGLVKLETFNNFDLSELRSKVPLAEQDGQNLIDC